jgi:hypothetical protein
MPLSSFAHRTMIGSTILQHYSTSSERMNRVVACQYGNAMGAQRCTGAELNVYLSREETERQILAAYGPPR